jgi:hypothetical protein
MGEARRRNLAGAYPTRTAQERDFIAMLHEMLAQEPAYSDVTGVTYFPPPGQGEAVYISAADGKRRMGRKPDA